jgi:unsaturated chondroitin disaccharide hydrolase
MIFPDKDCFPYGCGLTNQISLQYFQYGRREKIMKYELNSETEKWLNCTWEKIKVKMSAQCDRIGDNTPYIPVNGRYPAGVHISWWTNGFWPGMLWQMYHAANDEKYRVTAEKVEKRLDEAFDHYDGITHDVGFMWLFSSVANFRLTGNKRSLTRGMHAADLLAGRFNSRGKFIRAWTQDFERTGWVIIDSMMNLGLLYWASEVSGDPRFKFIAADHADTALKHIMRGDGSCNHIVILNPENGDFIDNPRGKGYDAGSSWTRGQSWAVYGFILSYLRTGDTRYLNTAKNAAHYFIANLNGTDFVPPVDFRSPKEPVMLDTTAGVCVACGMLEIANAVSGLEKPLYINAAIRILKSVETKYCNWNPDEDSIVSHGTAEYHSAKNLHVPIIYGDYFFIEAILRLTGKDFLIW